MGIVKKLFYWISLLVMAAGLFTPVSAQDQVPTARLYNLKTAAFPSMSASLDVFAEDGGFISGLTKKDLTILEDGSQRPADRLESVDPGLELAVAVNPGYSLALLDNKGVSRFDKIAQALEKWVGSQRASDLAAYDLVTTGGASAFHVRDPQSWLTSLKGYQPDFRKLNPSSEVLTRAIDLVSGSMLPPGSRKALLYITPMAEDAEAASLQSLALRASQLDVHVFVWVVASADSQLTPGFQALQSLATSTAGQWLLYSGKETLPDPETLLTPLRVTYLLTYTSGLTGSGKHSLSVKVKTATSEVEPPPLTFDLTILPPNPILVTPPEQIQRTFRSQGSYDPAAMLPASQRLDVIIEFPDGHVRELASTSLLVDGQVIQTNQAKPFDSFTWDLSGYSVSGQHEVQVVAVDNLGLKKTSIPIPIQVNVQEPPPAYLIFLIKNKVRLAYGIGAAGVLVLAWMLVRLILRRRQGTVEPAEEPSIITSARGMSAGRKKYVGLSAWLEPVAGYGNEPKASIPLIAGEMRLGSNPALCTLVLDDPTVSPLHALIRCKDQVYSISDQGSVAGTWVNYESIGSHPRELKQGDTVHIGLLTFRFRLGQPTADSQVQVHL